jgi:geranylgeranyl pyrophosphate synthase
MSALAAVQATTGLDAYLGEVEERLAEAVSVYPGLVAEVSAEALAAGGKRLRPALAFLASSPGCEPPVTAGVAVELVHMATLVHDDLIDGAPVRRGHAAAWTEHGPEAAKATGDFLFARAFTVLAEQEDPRALEILARASLELARGEAMQRRQRYRPETSVDDYIERCRLKTGALFAAACLLAHGSADYGRLLGIAFQIADDILDCAGETIETGKVPGTDLRDGTPTLPLQEHRRASTAPGVARSSKRWPRPSSKGATDRRPCARADAGFDPGEGRGVGASRLRGRPRASRVGRSSGARRARRHGAEGPGRD